MEKELDNSGLVGKKLMDLLKAYGYFLHDLLIAQFEAHGMVFINLVLICLIITKVFVKNEQKLALMLLGVFPRNAYSRASAF